MNVAHFASTIIALGSAHALVTTTTNALFSFCFMLKSPSGFQQSCTLSASSKLFRFVFIVPVSFFVSLSFALNSQARGKHLQLSFSKSSSLLSLPPLPSPSVCVPFRFHLASFLFQSLFCCTTVPLLISQLSTVFCNETTLENSINYRMRHRNPHFVNPFNVGVVANIRQFMGDSVLEWFIPRPLPRTPKAGLSFPLRKKTPASMV